MSWCVYRQIERAGGLSGPEKSVLMVLALKTNPDTGQCNPSITTLMAITCQSRSTVLRAVKGLRSKRWLTVNQTHEGRSNHYNVVANGQSGGPQTAPGTTPKPVSEGHQGGVTETPGGVSEGRKTSVRGTPNTKGKEKMERKGKEAAAPQNPHGQVGAEPSATMKPGAKRVGRTPRTSSEIVAEIRPVTPPDEVMAYYRSRSASPRMLEFFWRSMLRANFPDVGATVGFTQKEVGQIKALYRKLGDQRFSHTIDRVFARWQDYAEHCETNWGAFKSPARPTLAYMLKFAQASVEFVQTKPQVQLIAQNSVGVAKPEPPKHTAKPDKPEDAPMTLDELLAFEEGGKKHG